MFCPGCGHTIPDEARFCPYCGSQIKYDTSFQAEAPATPEPTTITVPSAPKSNRDHKIQTRRIAIIITMCLLALSFVTALGVVFVGRAALSHGTTEHPVTFRANSVDLGDDSSRIPVLITGTDANGDEVNKEFFLARDGVDCELLPGTYHLKVLASPIGSNGTLFELTVSEIDFEVPANLKAGEEYIVPSTKTLVFTPIDPAKVTDEEIEDAVAWARKDTDPSVDADALEAAARALRDNPPIVLDTETMPMV